MCNVCCKEFGGWFKSFTKLERALAILEAILLVVLVVLLILLILHLIICSRPDDRGVATPHTKTTTDEDQVHNIPPHPIPPSHFRPENGSGAFKTDDESGFKTVDGLNISSHSASGEKINRTTEPGAHCSWTPSAKTTAAVHYYEDGSTSMWLTTHSPTLTSKSALDVTSRGSVDDESTKSNVTASISVLETDSTPISAFDPEGLIEADLSDGEEAEDEFKSYVVALVKLKPPKDVIFGCILTIVSEFWTLTAASCIEAIEEVDSLDSFVIMERYGSNKKGPLQTIEDVQIHPLYEGKNKSYDLAALKSGSSLTKVQGVAVKLPSHLDFALMTIGERLTILGYGAYRSIDKSESGRRLRQAAAYRLGARQCAAGGSEATLRHLLPGRAVPEAACGTAPLCCGALFARGLPCNYCSGTPLLRGSLLLGVMADNRLCGVACEPNIYVNIADVADWIQATLSLSADVDVDGE